MGETDREAVRGSSHLRLRLAEVKCAMCDVSATGRHCEEAQSGGIERLDTPLVELVCTGVNYATAISM